MATTPNDQLLAWLNDAYAMEQSITEVLQNHIGDAKHNPTLQARLQQHLEETKQHGELVKGLIEGLGGDTSSIKAGMAGMMGRMQGLSTALAGDELVKDSIGDYSTAFFEIASYKALIIAAQQLGATQVANTCHGILQQEIAMAQFLDQQLPLVVEQTLQHEASAS